MEQEGCGGGTDPRRAVVHRGNITFSLLIFQFKNSGTVFNIFSITKINFNFILWLQIEVG